MPDSNVHGHIYPHSDGNRKDGVKIGDVDGTSFEPIHGEEIVSEEASESSADRNRGTSSRTAQDKPIKGIATWYGYEFHGGAMRNGDPFDAEDATTTAANVFPLGTWLRVTNISSGASIDVLVTDTGAFRYPIVVDLSLAAFERLADPDVGVLEVSVVPLRRD